MPKPLNLTKAVKDVLDQIFDKKLLDQIGSTAAGTIQKRTRLGKGVAKNEGKLEPLKPLSEGYKKSRRKNKSKLSPQAKANKSNLTFTGKMLDSLDYKIDGDTVIISLGTADANRKGRWVTDQGRPFMNLADTEVEAIRRVIRKKIREVTRKNK